MIYDYHVVLGIVTVAMVFLAYGLYFRSIFRGETKPHPFTWFLFLVLDGTVFTAQVVNGAGPGAWSMGVGTLLATIVFMLSLRWGEKRIARFDWICLCVALLGIAGWIVTSNALVAVVLASLTDSLAKAPTIRKSYSRPYEESLSLWSIDIFRFILSIFALSSITLTTALSPAEIVLTNALVVAVILFRRRQLAARAETR